MTELSHIIIGMRDGVVEVMENKAIVIGECTYETHREAEIRAARKKADGDGRPKLVRPRQARNAKCACGSGKKFKNCCIG